LFPILSCCPKEEEDRKMVNSVIIAVLIL